ncbi:glycosaminoglycan (GAG) polysaccharide lyase [Metarhizium robertsii]|uniref:Polysaccharide lyase family 8 protein n=2 Tax=Metarhizium robertsii TaxID=568076 RepID=E9EZT0_METRA|nr:polysaccharide lyase family 8 protein [Metarhizium robertsii ARSEF 23]EFY99471.2 polysaccharide lyase family 8 protein [Metarhizium robertsii ARSEF 23]EXV04487.1 glycosaminoglycan (GAG) polysaccharide lyase [Metarhizium robertsii]
MRTLLGYLVLAGSGILHGVQAASRDDELALISKRRIADLAQFPDPTWFSQISAWLDTQKSDGTWPDVNYMSGCAAQRANWPIQVHWNRIITFAAAWSGANPAVAQNWTRSDDLMEAISRGLDYWFSNDYTPADCMGNGGKATGGCPCGTPGLWNTNWYGQAILIPQLCSTACLLLKDANLTKDMTAGCERIPRRSYDLRDGVYGSGGRMTGANAVLVMQNSASLALYSNNATMLQDAYARAMSVMTYADKTMEDGIHRDGTFLQHNGILYNGNYGKDLFNAFIQLEGEAIGTSFAAGNATRDAIAAQVRGNEWMIFVDQQTKQEHWDFNAIGRFVAFPTQDLQANADINFNTTKLAGAVADFAGANDANDTIRRLKSNGTEKLVGNKGFWASDYMVHRTKSFVLGNKMLSTRSRNTESVNSANPYGYHLGQGTLFSYVEGNEYKDIMGAWDWNLIPGTTTLLNHTRLSAGASANVGKKDFVGVVSDGRVGAAVQEYADPLDGSISYRKAWFYQDDFVLITTQDIKKTVPDAPVVTVLDNRAAAHGNIWVDGRNVQADGGRTARGRTLFYGGNGYLSYDKAFDLTLFEGKRTGNWSEISTSPAGVTTVSIFSAYATIADTCSAYAVFPASSRGRLAKELEKPSASPIIKSGISGAVGSDRLSLVFWPGGDGSIKLSLREIGWAESGSVNITSAQPGSYLFSGTGKRGKGMTLVVTLSDPTQKAASASFSLNFDGARARLGDAAADDGRSGNETEVKYTVDLPTGGMAGSSTSRKMYVEFR